MLFNKGSFWRNRVLHGLVTLTGVEQERLGQFSMGHGFAYVSPASLPGFDHPDAVWLYLRFTLSYRDVEELLAEREIDVSYAPS
jgi:hypothetical protein